jgi:DNA invertase Pin-like site-specific DNA recombinase
MVIDWNKHENVPDEPSTLIRAAEYVRMSTEHQKYSTENQAVEIRRYAERRGYEIVKTYADEGKSGLSLGGRKSLQRLLDDIEKGRADFEAVLVYDVSRWGRFQDPDEAASYELRCRQAGIAIHYCAEQFENDGTIGSSIIKTVKRAMAGEYSRELSVKVFAGQSHLIELGYRQGGAPGFGLRRMLVDQSGEPKSILTRGEHKSIATDRVILVPGPEEEIALVGRIYHDFLNGKSEREIASALNAQGIMSDLGRPWTRGSIHQILINEKYVGNNVWGRTSFKLKKAHVRNLPGDWLRADGAFAAIVERDLFDQAQVVIAARSARLSDEDMLELLGGILLANGHLSGLIIDEAEACPSSSVFRHRFGSLLRAYSLVGFEPAQDYRYLEINKRLRRLHPDIVKDIISGVEATGGMILQDLQTDVLLLNDEVRVAIVIARCCQTAAGNTRWKIRLDALLKPDLTIAVRMDEHNNSVHDYYLLPHLDMREAVLRLAEHNELSFDAYRVRSLDSFYELAKRAPARRAA